MAAVSGADAQSAPGGEKVVLDVDGKPKNKSLRANMFEEEIVLTEKQKLRKELLEHRSKVKEKIKTMTPYDIFTLFDEDDSGLISFEEFRKMLPFLEININDAKAYRYFRLCDTDGSGEIDVDEFQVALFACDPTNGNPVGFRPSAYLTPMDSFEIFDEDESGFLEEDEYRYAIDYLKIKASDETLETLFHEFDYNGKGMIDYEEFREIFLQVCDVRQELEDRGIDCPSLVRKSTLRKMLKEVLMEEEDRERKALAEARRFKQWMLNSRAARKLLQKAEFRSYLELRNALDSAGQVYVVGSGSYNQFDQPGAKEIKTKKFNFEHFERVQELWKDRVQPQQLADRLHFQRKQEQREEERDADRNLNGLGALTANANSKKIIIDPYLEALESPFRGLNISLNTASLWARRIHQVAVSENVIFALADTGEVYSWGGNSYWWHEIQPDSIYQTKWRGDTTARSQLLLGTTDKILPPDQSLDQNFGELSPDEKKAEMIKVVAKYYNVWEPPPNPAQRMLFLDKDILPRIEYDQVKFALTCRGKVLNEMTKIQLIEALYEDISLEKKLLGERAHKAIKEIELQIAGLTKRKKKALAQKFLKRIEEMWAPLREVQAEKQAADIAKKTTTAHELQLKGEENYQEWRHRVHAKRENMEASFTPRGQSLDIKLQGATPRAAELTTPRGFEAGLQISAGTAHACMVHKTGQLYTWGVGISGRLGLDMTQQGNPQADVSQPTLVQGIMDRPVIRVSCGYSHTGVIVSGGEVYVWGSTATGKCGLGEITRSEECYCSVPTKVMIGPEDRRVRKISCGAAHSAVISEMGHLYVFGCADGGRLGLGLNRFDTCYVPTLVECLLHEKILSVSCGNSTTLVCTEINKTWVGDMDDKFRKVTGGRLYAAGASNVLGKQYNVFTRIYIDGDESLGQDAPDVVIKQVSAGFMHSAVLSAEGELFCWGYNKNGCCGVPAAENFVDRPTAVQFLYTRPLNLSLGKKAYQSSTYNRREAKYAVNGKTDGQGVMECTSTQQEPQPWIEIDLGKIAVIDKIVIWNRTDAPTDRNLPRDLYSARLFPCWVMVGRDPFPPGANILTLKESLRVAVCKAKLTEDKRVSTWRCPGNAQGRYVRIQLERYNTLSVAEIEVYGYWGYSRGVGRCSFVCAGRDVTVAVVRPSHDPRDVEFAYKRAVYSDSMNADILRQYETFALEYDKFGRGEVLEKSCSICKGIDKCESCIMYETFRKEIASMPPVVGHRRRRLKSISEFLINSNKPPLAPVKMPKMERPEKFKVWHLWRDWTFKNKLMAKVRRRGSITPEEALTTDPQEMMSTLHFMQKSRGNEKREVTIVEEFAGDSIAPSGEEANSALLPAEESLELTADGEVESQADDMSSALGTVTGHEVYRHGHAPKKKMEVGELLPSGQKIKEAYPRSIAQQIEDHKKRTEQVDNMSQASSLTRQNRKGRRAQKKDMALSPPPSAGSQPKGILKR